ncbi:hypothetical protein HPB49_014259 [Dermacentor silvarum]|uniref:Uncharacterized protein n=1 Tax=Dermacentor silvarum TaxID=543639 RepID=A0ACB8CFD4_DERSI|nr:hypothetical protein HPB49_014259 [Dermacentor silvarum]
MAMKALERLTNLIDTELQRVGGQKTYFPCLVPSSLFKKTGRLDKLGQELFTLMDRRDHNYCLGPTHEEAVTQLVTSLKTLPQASLPLMLYQITPKFRDEARPKFGLLRCREFIMKDMYSFDKTTEEAASTYNMVCEAYMRILKQLEVPFVKVKASTGAMGGSYSHEFHFLNDIGEDHLHVCTQCQTGLSIDEASSGCQNETCENCGGRLQEARGIEVAHAFSLGTTYSEPLNATTHHADGKHSSLDQLRGAVLMDDRDDWTIGRRLKDLDTLGMPYVIVAGKKIGTRAAASAVRRRIKKTATTSPASRRRGSRAGRSPSLPPRPPPTRRGSTFSRAVRAPASGRRDGCGMVAFYTFGMLDLEQLVAEVEKHPLLYDPGHREQRDFFKRAQAWRAIAKAMNTTPSACKRQWRSVRDRFVREERLSKLQSETEADRLAKWGLYKHLGFLVKAYQSRQSLGDAAGSENKAVVVDQRGPSPAVQSVQPLQLQAVQLVQTSAGEGDKGAVAADYEAGSECVILHPDAITQSVLLSMVNMPSPEEIIIPDQPSSIDLRDSTNCKTKREVAIHFATVLPLRAESNSAPNDPSVVAQSWRRKRKSSTTTKPTLKRSRCADGGPGIGVDDGDNRAVGSNGNDRDDVSSTNALLHHLVTATERVKAAAEAATQCRLPHLDPGDSDTMFLLSLRERLKSFGPRERSLALVKIQEVLHEIEFGTAAR